MSDGIKTVPVNLTENERVGIARAWYDMTHDRHNRRFVDDVLVGFIQSAITAVPRLAAKEAKE